MQCLRRDQQQVLFALRQVAVDWILKRPVVRPSVLIWLSLVRDLKASGVGN